MLRWLVFLSPRPASPYLLKNSENVSHLELWLFWSGFFFTNFTSSCVLNLFRWLIVSRTSYRPLLHQSWNSTDWHVEYIKVRVFCSFPCGSVSQQPVQPCRKRPSGLFTATFTIKHTSKEPNSHLINYLYYLQPLNKTLPP